MHKEELEVILSKPVIAQIVSKFIVLINSQDMSQRIRDLSIPVNERNIPNLFSPTYTNEDKEIEELLVECSTVGLLYVKYRDKRAYNPLYQRKASVVFNIEFESICRELLSMPINNDLEVWIEGVNSSCLSLSLKNILNSGQPVRMDNKKSSEIIDRFEKYESLLNKPLLIRQASAWMFWGASKVLDNRSDITDTLGLIPLPIQLNIHLSSANALKVLFIENSQTYEYAKRNRIFEEYTLVYSSGYAATSKRIRTKNGSSLYFSNVGSLELKKIELFQEWLYKGKEAEVYFWGDLDYSGIGIYLALSKVFTNAQFWEPGYSAMLEAVKEYGHSIKEAKKGEQKELSHESHEYIDIILVPIMKKYGFYDQEGIFFI